MLADQVCQAPSAGIVVNRADAGRQETVYPAIPSLIFLGTAHVIAIHRRYGLAPSLYLPAERDTARVNRPQNIEIVVQRHYGADDRLTGGGRKFGGVAIVRNSKRSHATVGPRLLRGPGRDLSHIGYLIGRPFDHSVSTRRSTSPGINGKHNKAPFIEICGLLVLDLVRNTSSMRCDQHS